SIITSEFQTHEIVLKIAKTMPIPSTEAIFIKIEKALMELAAREDPVFVMRIKSILLTNLDRGRLHYFIEDDILRVRLYVQKIVGNYRQFAPDLRKLQNDHCPQTWTALLKKLQRWIFNYLVRKGFQADAHTQMIAEELANEAAIQLLNAYFPFDAHFDAWAHVIVINTCRKYFRSKLKKSSIPDNWLVDIEPLHNMLRDDTFTEKERQAELHETIHKALAQLPDARREVIELTYLQGISIKEAAEHMGKSVGALYSLRFYALEDLREILGQTGNSNDDKR
ncbi:MAG: RNA polymerase sigma factor, partial [Chloroflexi bacterium]|nr:RNA polymerase sigma factor [Chloroflexota bacterium]